MTLFGDRVLTGNIKLRWGSLGGVSHPFWLVSLCKRKIWTQRYVQKGDNVRRHREEMAVYKPGERPATDPAFTAFKRNQPANMLTLNFQPPELWTFSLRSVLLYYSRPSKLIHHLYQQLLWGTCFAATSLIPGLRSLILGLGTDSQPRQGVFCVFG